MSGFVLTNSRSDVLAEVVNMGVGLAAGILQSMLDCHIELRIPRVELISPDELNDRLACRPSPETSSVLLSFSGSLVGDSIMVFSRPAARKLVSLLTGEAEESPDVDLLCGSTVTEVGNIVLNGIVGTLTNTLGLSVDYEVPCYSERAIVDCLNWRGHLAAILLVHTQIQVRSQPIEGEFLLCLKLESASTLMDRLDGLAA